MSPANWYVETLTPSGTELGGGAFGRQIGLDEVTRVGPHDGLSALIRNTRALTSVAQLFGHQNKKQKVAGSIPSQGTCLGCGLILQSGWGVYKRQLIAASPPQ